MGTISEKLQAILDSKADIKAAIEEKGVEVEDAPLSLYADKIAGIQGCGDGEIETLLKNNGYDMLIDPIMYPLLRSIELNNNGVATWNDYTATTTNYTRCPIIDPAHIMIAGTSNTDYNDALLYVGENVDFSEVTELARKYRYSHNLTVFKPSNFPVCTSFETAFARTGLVELNIIAPLCVDIGSWCQHSYKLKKVNIVVSSTDMVGINYAFDTLPELEELTINNGGIVIAKPDSNNYIRGFLYSCPRLKVVTGIIDISNILNFQYTTDGSTALETVYFKGLKSGGLSFQQNPNITVESILYLFNNAQDVTGTGTQRIYLGATNMVKLTDEQKAIATNKGYTLVS